MPNPNTPRPIHVQTQTILGFPYSGESLLVSGHLVSKTWPFKPDTCPPITREILDAHILKAHAWTDELSDDGLLGRYKIEASKQRRFQRRFKNAPTRALSEQYQAVLAVSEPTLEAVKAALRAREIPFEDTHTPRKKAENWVTSVVVIPGVGSARVRRLNPTTITVYWPSPITGTFYAKIYPELLRAPYPQEVTEFDDEELRLTGGVAQW